MQDPNVKNNYFTFPDRRPGKSKDQGEIDEILTMFGSSLPYVHTANISGAKIQLRTNSEHVSNFWKLNWYPAESKEAEGAVHVINGLEGYEPHLFYNLDERKMLIVNSEYYGAAKSAGALGLAGAILEERRCVFDEGADRCYWSYGNSRVMFPRSMFPILLRNDQGLMYEAFKGEGNVIDEAAVNYVILLTRDDESPPIRKFGIDEAIEVLREGSKRSYLALALVTNGVR